MATYNIGKTMDGEYWVEIRVNSGKSLSVNLGKAVNGTIKQAVLSEAMREEDGAQDD